MIVMGLLAAVGAFRRGSAETDAHDREDLQRLAAGDGDAAARLYDRHARAAWAYFQAGRIPAARAASLEAVRTGSTDRRIRCHARAIEHAAKCNVQSVATHCGFETWITDASASY